MKLLVDIGNSYIKWAILDKKIGDSNSFARGKTGIKAGLTKNWKSLEGIKAIYVANVAGDKIAQQLIEWTQKTWQLEPIFVRSEKKRFGVSNAYKEPEKLGVDRWLSLVAAKQHSKVAQCIIDCGTAVTIDIISAQGQHQGGMILPGLSLMRSSLANNTNALTEEADEQAFKMLASNTFSAIQSGTLYSISSTIENIVADLQDNFNDEINFTITGGDAESLLPILPSIIEHKPDAVLHGLVLYARQTPSKIIV